MSQRGKLNLVHGPRLRLEMAHSPGGDKGYLSAYLTYAQPRRGRFFIWVPRAPRKTARWRFEHQVRFYSEIALRDYRPRRPWRFNREDSWP